MHVFLHTSGAVGDVLSQGLTIDEETCGFEPFGRVAIDSLYLYSKTRTQSMEISHICISNHFRTQQQHGFSQLICHPVGN